MERCLLYPSRIISIILLFFFGQLSASAQEVPTEALDNAMKNGDTVLLEKLLDPELTWLHSNGYTNDKTTLLQDVKEGKVIYHEVSNKEILESKRLKEDIISLQRIILVKGEFEKTFFELNLNVIEIWVKRDNIWKLYNRAGVQMRN